MVGMGKILIVDDSPSVLKSAELVLRMSGFDVLTCSDAWCAGLILGEMPDLVLMDVRLKGLQGDQAVRAIMALPEIRQGCRIVLHSNMETEELSRLCDDTRAFGYMQKSKDPDEFVKRVKELLERPLT